MDVHGVHDRLEPQTPLATLRGDVHIVGEVRQAAKTASGRERLEALLADYSQKSVGVRNAFEPEIVALKQKLGLG